MAENAQIADRIRIARLEAGHTNGAEFARAIGVQPETLYRYERGTRTPTIGVAHKIAKRCGVDLSWLVSGEGPRDRATGARVDQAEEQGAHEKGAPTSEQTGDAADAA